MAAVLFAIRRRRAIDWLAGLLLAIAWSRLTEMGGYVYQQWANDRIMGWQATPTTTLLTSTFLVQLPQLVVAYVPPSVAIVDLIRTSGRRRDWVEWASACLGLSLPVGFQARYLTRNIIESRAWSLSYATWLVSLILALGLAFLLARRSERAWRRLLGWPAAGP